MNSTQTTHMIIWQSMLGILGICVDFCGKVLMLKNEFGKVSEFLEQLKIGLYQRVCFWSKVALSEF
jgi:hypothetical protein